LSLRFFSQASNSSWRIRYWPLGSLTAGSLYFWVQATTVLRARLTIFPTSDGDNSLFIPYKYVSAEKYDITLLHRKVRNDVATIYRGFVLGPDGKTRSRYPIFFDLSPPISRLRRDPKTSVESRGIIFLGLESDGPEPTPGINKLAISNC